MTGPGGPMSGLQITDLDVAYDGALAVRGVSLDLPQGQILAVLGPSGSGKSTLLRAVAGLEPVAAGRIAWAGDDLAGVPTHMRGFALMFQDGQLFGHLTVARNVAYPLRLRRTDVRRREARVSARVHELLELVGLAGHGERLPSTLSGGERQRVALARALAVEPRLLLLDEPLSALDTGLRERLVGDLARILREAGTTALMVTHDQEEAFEIADRLAVLRDGRLVQEGDIAAVWRAPADPETALFLGYARVLAGEPARRLAEAAQLPPGPMAAPDLIAVRRSALGVSAQPVPPLTGTVIAVRATPELVRLVVDVDGIGELDAIAPLDATATIGLAIGRRIGLAVDHARLARIHPSSA